MIIEFIKKQKVDNDLILFLQRHTNLAMERDESSPTRRTTLQLAFVLHKSTKVLLKLIDIGGKKLVMEKDSSGETALHYACKYGQASIEILSKLTEKGGRDLVMINSTSRFTALHYACIKKASVEAVFKLVEIGGRDLVMAKSWLERTTLHFACYYNSPSEVISKLTEIGGKDLLMEKNDKGATALHWCILLPSPFYNYKNDINDIWVIMFKQGILAQVGGEFGIGGLFNSSTNEQQNQIYENWERIVTSLQIAIVSLQHHQPPILHAAILANSPQHIIIDIINRFDCILKKDSFSRLPLNIIVKDKVRYNEKLLETILKATAAAQKCSIIHVADQYGLGWSDKNLKELVGQT